ncbi:hypothetical protein DV096_05520 [Bradymonadaceae bacterium TMQ3]|uniref:CAP domain-containing protein n=1 Tax=Lujinxingia sediminis TaxID=2480984 RepID=A0ABY0CVQ9_9DELT|nr:hypothetical protein [Lujinxingia sediminis]RDV40017.1 hypothetical protein DV096_05520 [Bradymonadaceae bacterium TMQ3]RVU47936.1 hypothetical protein EA187_00430 [Lujinxingia sediminis]TXC77237.1 hypothetical protein FRC91_00425 [Bradymonadales bacterium TMQ1]
MKIPSTLRVLLKLGVSGAVIVAIGATVLVSSSPGEVKEAEADLTDFLTGPRAEQRNFERVIAESGLKPRSYDYNGNDVYFAAGDSELSPSEVLTYYQERFHAVGVNSKVYTEPLMRMGNDPTTYVDALAESDYAEQNHAMLNGEVVPLHVSDELVTMGSMVPRKQSDDVIDMIDTWPLSPQGGLDIEDNMRSYRLIEARRNLDTGGSTVTASWAADGFDPRLIRDPDAPGARPDLNVPACAGCERVSRLAGNDPSEPYVVNLYRTNGAPESVERFYRSAMVNRGWTLSKSTELLDEYARYVPQIAEMSGELLNFERDGHHVSLVVQHNDEGGTTVVSIEEGPKPL